MDLWELSLIYLGNISANTVNANCIRFLQGKKEDHDKNLHRNGMYVSGTRFSSLSALGLILF